MIGLDSILGGGSSSEQLSAASSQATIYPRNIGTGGFSIDGTTLALIAGVAAVLLLIVFIIRK